MLERDSKKIYYWVSKINNKLHEADKEREFYNKACGLVGVKDLRKVRYYFWVSMMISEVDLTAVSGSIGYFCSCVFNWFGFYGLLVLSILSFY